MIGLNNRLGLHGLCDVYPILRKWAAMAVAEDIEDEEPAKKSKLPLILGVVFALVGGGGGFFAVSSGMLLGSGDDAEKEDHAEDHEAEEGAEALPPLAFVPLEPLTISLPSNTGNVLLRFRGELEVPPEYQEEVAAITPRIIDVLNGYLRAVDLVDLQDPTVLVRLRGQMLRRVQVVAGAGRVRDLLIMEFVLN